MIKALFHFQFGSYVAVGVIATLCDWMVFQLSNHYFSVSYQFALLFGLLSGSAIHYILNKSVTFRCRSRQYVRQISLYLLMTLFSYFASLLFMSILLHGLHFSAFLSRAIVTFLMLYPNYFLHKTVTFAQFA